MQGHRSHSHRWILVRKAWRHPGRTLRLWRPAIIWGMLCCATFVLVLTPISSGLGALVTANLSGEQHQAIGQLAHIFDPAGHGPTPQIGTVPTNASPGRFTTETFTGTQGQKMTYYLYVPAGYKAGTATRYPVTLVLHGDGERQSSGKTAAENRAQILGQSYVSDFAASDIQSHWPSFIVVPQIGNGTDRWVNVPGEHGAYTLQMQPSASLQMAINIFASVEHAYHAINTNRAYIAGISMGGYGVWDAIERWPTLFAAAAPVSGAGDPQHANVLKNLPIWDFHGTADTAVPVSGSEQMYAALSAVGAKECYSEFPGLQHDLWITVKVYAQPEVLSWLFSQTRSPAKGQTPPSCKGRAFSGVTAK